MDTSKLLAPTHKLFEALEIFQVTASLQPSKSHWGAHIKLQDFQFNKDHLVNRMIGFVIDWVFSKTQAKEIFDAEYGTEGDISSATATLYHAARETFRIDAPQGQFGELLLSGFLQHIFNAAPLLRKQPVRTSDSHERFGADAIHFCNKNGNHLYVGESKCYQSSYQFPSAFSKSIESMNTTLANFGTEIRKFKVGGFLEDQMKPVASAVLRNTLTDLTIHPVIIIIYDETKKLNGADGSSIKQEILECINHQCGKIQPAVYAGVAPAALQRFTYIIMPVWDLEDLLNKFVEAL